MPNRPICAEDALLSETPMPPEQILRYLDRIGLRDPKTIQLLVDDATLAERKAKWVCPEPKIKTGYLARYAKMVSSADKGAILE